MYKRQGYEGTSIEAVLKEAGVSRGSLYHHFASKEALFEAVAEDVETSVGEQTLAAAAGSDGPLAALRAGFLAWIRLAGDPVVRRILLIDAPSVLGWERWRSMEEDHALGLIRAVLQVIAEEGKLRPELVGTLAHVLFAAGEVAGFGGGGMHGYRSLEGSFLGGCLFSGRQAGRAAARETGA